MKEEQGVGEQGVEAQLGIWRAFPRKSGPRGRTDVFQRRVKWFDRQPEQGLARLIFIDKSRVSTKMIRLRGRLYRKRPMVNGKRYTGRRARPIYGAMNCETFLTSVQSMVVRGLSLATSWW